MIISDEILVREQPATRLASRKILVAEDNALNRVLIQAILEQMGHRVDLVNDGLQAVAQVQQSPYDLVLMDIQMPRMDGLQATRAIRGLRNGHAGIPIIAVTANEFVVDRTACLAAGCDGYSPKPIDVEHLTREIDRVCSVNRPVHPTP